METRAALVLSALFPFQKWQCVEDPTGKLRLYKCKGMASLYAPRMQALMARSPASLVSAAAAAATATSNSCNCAASAALQAPVIKRKRLFPKKSEFPALFLRSTVVAEYACYLYFTVFLFVFCFVFQTAPPLPAKLRHKGRLSRVKITRILMRSIIKSVRGSVLLPAGEPRYDKRAVYRFRVAF